ncbi:hypothetical protein CSOJ01_00405 [Colletotrichum sojae]|uniref:Uncharacterized protein n=1 Tax=Colletotrichum sojae TaxID=2175907 RepID=A0A8H6N668_9PEZI|nr:hypothetical protein CSOJ01_00405 [Colletotrichum sojae]
MCCDAMLRRQLALPRPMGSANPSLFIRRISIGRKLPVPKDVPVPAFRAQTDAPLWGAGVHLRRSISSVCNVLCHVESFSAHGPAISNFFYHAQERGRRGKKKESYPAEVFSRITHPACGAFRGLTRISDFFTSIRRREKQLCKNHSSSRPNGAEPVASHMPSSGILPGTAAVN